MRIVFLFDLRSTLTNEVTDLDASDLHILHTHIYCGLSETGRHCIYYERVAHNYPRKYGTSRKFSAGPSAFL